MRKWENLLLLICIGLRLDVFITRQARLHLATRPSCYQAFIVVLCRDKNCLSLPLLFLCSSSLPLSTLSLPLLLNALCNILIKKFLQSLLPSAGCWLIMRSHCCARLNSTWFDGALRRKNERTFGSKWQADNCQQQQQQQQHLKHKTNSTHSFCQCHNL